MQAGDLVACVGIINSDRIVGPRYGPAIHLLPAVWSRLLGREAFRAFVIELSESGREKIIMVDIAVFVTDDFAGRMKTRPFMWIGPELTQRIAEGDSPLLSDHEVAAANSSGTLNCLLWSGCVHPQYVAEPEVLNFSVRTFFQVHSGYYLRELVAQAENECHLQEVLASGGLVLCDRKGTYRSFCAEDVRGLWQRPHVLGITRELAERQIGTWISTIFRYQRPRLALTRKQQRLLTTAMNGSTDPELAAELGVSLAVVKKSWRDIYDRVHDCIPNLFPSEESRERLGSERGRAKKHRLLSYVREHPEELRLIARRSALWCAKIPSGSHLTDKLALICSASLLQKTREASPAWQKTLLSRTHPQKARMGYPASQSHHVRHPIFHVPRLVLYIGFLYFVTVIAKSRGQRSGLIIGRRSRLCFLPRLLP